MDANSANKIFVRTIEHLARICTANQVLNSIEKQVESFVQKNEQLVIELENRLERLDPVTYPRSASLPEYRWKRLVKDLDELNDKLGSFRTALRAKQLEAATRTISYELWPLVLKLSCHIADETGKVGTSIDDLSSIYRTLEKYKKLVAPHGETSLTNSSSSSAIRAEAGPSDASVIVIRQHTMENNNNERNND